MAFSLRPKKEFTTNHRMFGSTKIRQPRKLYTITGCDFWDTQKVSSIWHLLETFLTQYHAFLKLSDTFLPPSETFFYIPDTNQPTKINQDQPKLTKIALQYCFLSLYCICHPNWLCFNLSLIFLHIIWRWEGTKRNKKLQSAKDFPVHVKEILEFPAIFPRQNCVVKVVLNIDSGSEAITKRLNPLKS